LDCSIALPAFSRYVFSLRPSLPNSIGVGIAIENRRFDADPDYEHELIWLSRGAFQAAQCGYRQDACAPQDAYAPTEDIVRLLSSGVS
jgi:hypothetical protein